MDLNVWNARREAGIEGRIDSLPVNAAHREMALSHHRHAVAAAERAAELIESLRSICGSGFGLTRHPAPQRRVD